MTQPISLEDRFYLIRTLLPSCIKLPEDESKSFEIKPQFINTLPKYHDLESEDAYFFIREFEEVSLMMRMPHLGDDAIRLHLFSFRPQGPSQEMTIQFSKKIYHIVGRFHQSFLKKFLHYP